MTFAILKELIEKNNIPEDVRLTSDSGWECDATDMDGVYYSESRNEIVFTQEGGSFDRVRKDEDFVMIYGVSER